MSHQQQDNDRCGHERNENDHDHNHEISEVGPRDSLFKHIDRPHVTALNAGEGRGPEVIKPWHERNDSNLVRKGNFMLCLFCERPPIAVPDVAG